MIKVEGVFWCVAFFLLGPLLILLNSHVFNHIGYRHPITFSSLGLWGTALVCHAGHHFGYIQIPVRPNATEFVMKRAIPIGIISAATIGTGNTVYLYLSVSFTQMLKALTPVYILLCLVMFKVEIPARPVVFSVLVISLGTAVASLGELKFSWIGFFLQSLADLLEGSRLVLLQIFMAGDALSPVESMYWISPATAIAQLILVLLYERSAITDPQNWVLVADHWYLFFLAIILGTAVNFVGLFVIKHTSGLMLKLLGVVRNNCLVLFSILFLHDKTTPTQVAGYVVSIIGFIWYTSLRQAPQTGSNSFIKREYTRVVDEEEMQRMVTQSP